MMWTLQGWTLEPTIWFESKPLEKKSDLKRWSREDSASKDVEAHGAFTMQAMHQQFERLILLFEEIKDRMDGQDAAIATL